MGGGYSFPMTSKFSVEMNAWNSQNVAVSMQGNRDTDEDAALLLTPIPNFPNCRITGVFDGHSGSRTSLHCVRRIASILGECKSLSQPEIENACIKLDREIRGTIYREEGSTGIFVIVEKLNVDGEFRLLVCNVGDCRCLLLRSNGAFEKLSVDHKPTLPLEKLRIENANGGVIMSRVNGNMAVSRAFGDTLYKRNNKLSESEQLITCIPDVKECYASADDIIVLACDGIYEQLSWDDVAAFTRQQLNNNLSLYETAISLIDHSLVLGSLDNMTVLLTRLTDRAIDKENVSYEYLPGIVLNSTNDKSEQMICCVEELKSMGFNHKEIQEILSMSPKFEEKEVFSLPIFLEALLSEQRKLKTLKIFSFEEKEKKRQKNDNLFENTLHYIPFDAKRLEEEIKSEMFMCCKDREDLSLRLKKEEDTKEDKSAWFSDEEEEAEISVQSNSKLSRNRNVNSLSAKNEKTAKSEFFFSELENTNMNSSDDFGNKNFAFNSELVCEKEKLTHQEKKTAQGESNLVENSQEKEKEDEEYVYYDAVEKKIDLKNTQIHVNL